MKNIFFIIIFLGVSKNLEAQYISGKFPLLKNQIIKIIGFNGIEKYVIDSTKVSEDGLFILKYSQKNIGIGYIIYDENKYYLLVLEKEFVEIEGESFSVPESIIIKQGYENKILTKYIDTQRKIEKALIPLLTLSKLYKEDTFFTSQNENKKLITSEIIRVEKLDNIIYNEIPITSYLNWYLPILKIISQIPIIVQFKNNEIKLTLEKLRELNYNDPRLYKSGLINDIIEGQFWLIKNSGISQDSITMYMIESVDMILNSVSKNEALYNELTKYFFDYFEKNGILEVSFHLSKIVLTQKKVKIYDNISIQLQTYKKMNVGSIAPEIIFNGDIYKNMKEVIIPSRLSSIDAKYKVIIFGASWCPSCSEEISKLFTIYPYWKMKGIEVVFVSMDTDKDIFKKYVSIMPFISFCDYQKWNTKAVKEYFVTSSPTIFLLDENNKIIFRTSVLISIDDWVKKLN